MTDPRPIRRNPDVLTDTLAVAGKQLIDVGCGNGHLVRHLARHGAQHAAGFVERGGHVLAHPRLRLAQTFDYLHPVVLADFAAFRERLVSANHEREARFAAHQAELSALFARSGQPVDDGRQFIQPMRVHLLHPLPPG